MKVAIITEGGKNIGFGHIARCISLFQAFESKGIIPQFIVKGDNSVLDLIKKKNCQIFDWIQDKEKVFRLMKNIDIVVIDSYLADISFYENLSHLVKVPVYLDDNKRLEYPAGVVVNGGVYACALSYFKKNDIKYLSGVKYAALRKEFWEVSPKVINENIERVMVTFGGDDNKSITLKVLNLLIKYYPQLNKKIILGKGFRNIGEIERTGDKKTEFIYYPDAERMKNVMLESDLAISAGGQTLYELARVGVATIAVIVADNQVNNVDGWKKTGFIKHVGEWDKESLCGNIKAGIEDFSNVSRRQEVYRIGKRLISGDGSRLVVDALISFC
jgi:UDP-2,4-diacetamido-2,4,6-trideoxy-beta-L-altropyranose hydrolase